MKANKFICLLAAVLASSVLLAGCGAGGDSSLAKTEETYDRTLRVNLGVEKKDKISPYIYGQFIEHIESCIYNGIWSEILLDRKFYYEIGEVGLSPWRAVAEDFVKSNSETTYSGGHSAEISAGGGIFQEELSLEKKEYSGYLYANASQDSKIKVELSSSAWSDSVEIDLSAGEGFQKYSFSFQGEAADNAKFTLSVLSGNALFDSLSLMPADNYQGMRRDTLELLKKLNGTMYRWPGGNFLSGYDWKDGIGDRDKRPSRRNLHYMGLESSFSSEAEMLASDMVNLEALGFYGGIEPNDFGTDEFLAFCEYLGAEPLMMVNDGLGKVEDAADLVEYCNGAETTEYGRQRAENGHKEPYEIEYWGIGNEMFGDWQLGHVPVSEYVQRHNLFAETMKEKDSSLRLIAVGNNASEWNDAMFENCAENMDYTAEHFYGERDEADVFKHISNITNNVDDRISRHRTLIKKYPACASVKIAFTEYAYDKAVTASRLKDGMGIAAVLNRFIENADVVEMACYSSTLNATQGCLTTTDTAATLQGAGYVLQMYRQYMQEYSLNAAVQADKEIGLDVSASVSADGKTITLAVVNPSEYDVRLDCSRLTNVKSIIRSTLTADYYDSDGNELYTEYKENLAYPVAPMMSVSLFVIEL